MQTSPWTAADLEGAGPRPRRRPRGAVALLLAGTLAGCSSGPTASAGASPSGSPLSWGATGAAPVVRQAGVARAQRSVRRSPATPSPAQVGLASWYGKPHHGRLTASGERYNMHRLTAAHPEHPMGTHLLVRNLLNGRAVEVRVNDRGPFVAGRVLDLSYAAAREVAAVADGVVPVRIHVVWLPPR